MVKTRGRGAPGNDMSERFGLPGRAADGDWLDAREEVDGAPPKLRTTVTIEQPRTIIARNSSPDIAFDQSINAYRGCEHGCIYCFARPTHSYLNMSPGLDFETRIIAKVNAAERVRATLASPGYEPQLLNLGAATDCYQPVER